MIHNPLIDLRYLFRVFAVNGCQKPVFQIFQDRFIIPWPAVFAPVHKDFPAVEKKQGRPVWHSPVSCVFK
jgi:hypothetical protein